MITGLLRRDLARKWIATSSGWSWKELSDWFGLPEDIDAAN